MIDILDIPAILRRHIIWLIAFPILFAALAVVFLALKTPQYRTSAELIIQPESVQVIQNDPAGTVANQSLQGMDLLSQAYIILSSPVLNQVANNLNLDDSPTFKRPGLLRRLLGSATNTRSSSEAREETLAILRDILEVVRLNQSLVFLIQVTHPDAQLAAAIANETATAYIEQIQSSRAESLGRASTSLTKQASQLRTRVDQAEAAIEAYKASQGLISTSGGSIVDQQIESLNTQITEARVELERAKATNERIAPLTLVDVESGALPQSASDSVLNSLRVQYARAAQQEAEAATTLGANHPTLLELRSQVNNTKRQIQDELQRIKTNVRSQYEQAQATLDALERQSEYLQSQNTTQGQALIELRQLQSDADASRAVYDAFLKRARELEELPELDTNSSRILSTATVPSSPNGPRGSIVLAAAMVFGFMTAAAGILGLAILKGPVASERQLVAETGIPILAKLNETGDRSGSFRPLKGLFGGRTSSSSLQGIAQTRVAYAIRQSLPDSRSANILVLSIGETGDTFKFTRKVAEELHEMGQEVLFAHTTGHEQPARQTPALSENGNPGLLNRLTAKLSGGAGGASGSPENQDRQPDLPGHSGLSKYLQVEQINPRRKYASSGDLNTANEAFLLVDAGNIDKSPLLPVLLRHCDTIILITALDGISMQDCKRTLAYLEPWQDRIIGNVVL
ncbi:GumC family protein [uncultured Roseibium sp.]|uniref:GumC family protein n=1 Tax=uncultured Roseibium sp. TaxID=1936171 RepID=UPI0026200339|nr:GumC family protein [uncultured Roseibium sp.]